MTVFDTVSAAPDPPDPQAGAAPQAGTAPAAPHLGTAAAAPRPGARPRTVAVVGSGVAGLTAAYRLSRAGVEVALFEADDRLGGHAHTQEAVGRDGRAVPLDTGFLVHNERTYPHLVNLFAELGVRTRDSEMSMSVRCDGCGLEYAGARGPVGLFARPDVLVRRRYLRLLAEVPRFHRLARRLLADPGAGEPSLREFLASGRFGTATRHTRLRLTRDDAFGPHYAETLRLWRERFTERSPQVAALGFDEVFRRMWELYLAHSEAGFRTGYLDLHQLLLTRDEDRP